MSTTTIDQTHIKGGAHMSPLPVSLNYLPKTSPLPIIFALREGLHRNPKRVSRSRQFQTIKRHTPYINPNDQGIHSLSFGIGERARASPKRAVFSPDKDRVPDRLVTPTITYTYAVGGKWDGPIYPERQS